MRFRQTYIERGVRVHEHYSPQVSNVIMTDPSKLTDGVDSEKTEGSAVSGEDVPEIGSLHVEAQTVISALENKRLGRGRQQNRGCNKPREI